MPSSLDLTAEESLERIGDLLERSLEQKERELDQRERHHQERLLVDSGKFREEAGPILSRAAHACAARRSPTGRTS